MNMILFFLFEVCVMPGHCLRCVELYHAMWAMAEIAIANEIVGWTIPDRADGERQAAGDFFDDHMNNR